MGGVFHDKEACCLDSVCVALGCFFFRLYFFFIVTATTEIYTLSLHDALPICGTPRSTSHNRISPRSGASSPNRSDRKSTRLNSSHSSNSYAVFCLKKKK